MHCLLREFSPEHDIPEFRRNPKPQLFPSEMMLVVVPLQLVEVGSFVLRGVDVMQRVVGEVVGKVAEQKTNP